jgi:hypothetical protein
MAAFLRFPLPGVNMIALGLTSLFRYGRLLEVSTTVASLHQISFGRATFLRFPLPLLSAQDFCAGLASRQMLEVGILSNVSVEPYVVAYGKYTARGPWA